MNNGNLLSSLLGATGANSAAGKTASAKNRPDTGFDSSEQFRNALEQARPEVAAPKPASRKTVAKAEPRQPAADARTNMPRDAQKEVSAGVNRKTEKSVVEKPTVEKKAAETQGQVEAQPSQAKESELEQQDTEHIVAAAGESDAPASQPGEENALAETGILLDIQTPDQETKSPLNILEGSLSDAASTDLTAEESTDETGKLAVDGVAPDMDPSVVNPLAAPTAELTANVITPLAIDAPAIELASETENIELPVVPALASISATNSLRAEAGSVAGTAQNVASNPPAGLANQLGQELAAGDNIASATGDTPPEVDAVDNPDLFILSGKAAFGKLMDANVAVEKMAAVVDPAKPALTAATLAEPLVRLSEAQSPAARSFVVQTGVPVTVGQPQWSQAVGEKVLWLAAQNVSAAEIRLDPPDLGPMHVKVTVNQDQASVSFTSPHPIVREALDQQLNRLREMFSEQGLNLVNVDVSDKSFAQQQEGEQGRSGGSANDAEDEELVPIAASTIVSTRLVDHYA